MYAYIMSALEEENLALKLENCELKNKIIMLEEKLALYIVSRNKAQRVYYKKHTELAQERTRTYLDNLKETDPDRLKAYRHQAYLNRKEKLKAKQETD